MPSDDDVLLRIAESMADGLPIDWKSAEATLPADLLNELKLLAELVRAHRRGDEDLAGADAGQPAPAAGPAWGPLQLRRELGRGRFGTVHVAWDPALEREVALKLLQDGSDADAVIREGRMIARVRHPNVVAVHGVDCVDGILGLWMELVDGLTLKEALAVHGAMTAREAALVGIDLARALAAVHRAGLLHRDIKAQNVMREPGGRIVLMDFGAGEVRAGDPLGCRGMTGTPLYLAPEIFHGAPASIASDIYSLGVLLYHLLTLRFPVEGDTFEAIREGVAQDVATPIVERCPDLPAGIARVIDRALQRDPALRYRSAGAMQQDLMRALTLEIGDEATLPDVQARSPGVPPSVAVLPFVNLGPDPDLEYFCSGLAEELLIGLGKVEGLRVASRTSSLGVKGSENTDIRSICRRLEVDAVLEGTVRKAGERLRITAQLVSAADGCHLWSEGYDRQMSDVFAVQDEIARSVVDRLKLRLNQLSSKPLIKRHTDNPRAYQLYLRGRFYWGRRYQGGLGIALEEFRKAIDEDAGYAQAYAGLADANAFLGFYSLRRPRTAFAEARSAAERALTLDPDLPDAHTSLALVKLGDEWDWPGAEREFRRALALDPGHAFARIYLSWLLVLAGDGAAGLAEARRAQELEPPSPLVNSGAAHALFLARRYDESVAECRKAFEVDPTSIVATYVMAGCRAEQGGVAEAIELMERAATMSDRAPFYLALLGNFYGRAGAREKAEGLLGELAAQASHRYVPPQSRAFIHAGLGELDEAFAWQAKAYDDGASPFNYFSPVIGNMRRDPRHVDELLRRGCTLAAY